MATPIKWDGSPAAVSGNTPYGFYDSDTSFQNDAKFSAVWAARKLGYPIIDVELDSANFYAAFEEAVNEYSYIVNNFNIKENMLTLQGSPTGSNLTGRLTRGSIGRIIKLAEPYGTEVGTGGDVDWKKGHIQITNGTQEYDLNTLWSEVSESGNVIKIRRIFQYEAPASARYFDPNYLQGNFAAQEFGFNSIGMGTGTIYLMRPIYEDMLRMQMIELNDQVRKNGYSFELVNNKLRIFPIPLQDSTLYFDYTVEKDTTIGYYSGSNGTSVITDHHNVPYNNMVYSLINSVGKQWIKKYFLCTAKQMLGLIRSKYASIPIPNSTVTLDGDTLRTEAINEKLGLVDELKEILDASSKHNQLNIKNEENDNIQKIINKIPMKIYIG